MNNYYYLDVKLKLRDEESAVITADYFLGCIKDSLLEFFGEVGAQNHLELLKFSETEIRGIIKIPTDFYKQTCAAITLIGHYQDIPCHFNVLEASQKLLDF